MKNYPRQSDAAFMGWTVYNNIYTLKTSAHVSSEVRWWLGLGINTPGSRSYLVSAWTLAADREVALAPPQLGQ